MTDKSKVLLASVMAMMGPELDAVLATQAPVSKTPRRSHRHQQPSLGMTEEQRAWNRAVDARKAAKKGR